MHPGLASCLSDDCKASQEFHWIVVRSSKGKSAFMWTGILGWESQNHARMWCRLAHASFLGLLQCITEAVCLLLTMYQGLALKILRLGTECGRPRNVVEASTLKGGHIYGTAIHANNFMSRGNFVIKTFPKKSSWQMTVLRAAKSILQQS